MTEPAPYDEDTPAVRLGGKAWPVPELAWRQLRKVRTPLMQLTDALAPTSPDTSTQDGLDRANAEVAGRVVRLSDEQADAMADVVFYGLTRAHPELTRNEFDGLTFTIAEMFAAFLVVRVQSGLFGRSDPKPGEAVAAHPGIPTGT